ncbi:MAG: aconitase/3-isopropylmalate dehydratase large subunit family protein [Candidatus Thermoplasmatota archaeon]|nr:aconitase/3-isopropylmalate dehydratase large subunit family protein [Candidatus Thermoplasmatota archaeon]
MGKTIIQKIFEAHSKQEAVVGDIIDIDIDVRVARDFGGANVVKNLEESGLSIDDAKKTFFTFDCNPGGCDQKYAANQHICRLYARRNNIRIYDIDKGIGTHLVIDEGLIQPNMTLVSTDSHANILGAVGAFGQGMGDKDIAHAWSYGKVWFKVPPSVKIILKGMPSPQATPKDVILCMLKHLGANGLLGYAAEIYGPYVDTLSLDGRITIASMATEAGGIIILFPPNNEVIEFYRRSFNANVTPLYADDDATYEDTITIDISDISPQISRPGHPEDVVDVSMVKGTLVDSGFIGSCTNGRMEDMRETARVLKGRHIAPGRVLKIVPATDAIWKQCLDEGLIEIFKNAGALLGSAGCAGCAAGQIGQTGEGEVEVSTGNRNFVGKQGKGQLYLASPATVAASLVSGVITTVDSMLEQPKPVAIKDSSSYAKREITMGASPVLKVEGRCHVIRKDNIDTDMIFHNRYLSITNIEEMGQYTFDNLQGYMDFSKKVKPGDILVVGKNFGCGSSRQQAVDCFKAVGVSVIIAESFGAIYERNAINNALPILVAKDSTKKIDDTDVLSIDFETGEIFDKTKNILIKGKPFSMSQLEIYKRGGLLIKN